MIRISNTSRWHGFYHMNKEKQTWQTTLPSITKKLTSVSYHISIRSHQKQQKPALWRQQSGRGRHARDLPGSGGITAVSWCTTSILHSWYRHLGSGRGKLPQALQKDIASDGSRYGGYWANLENLYKEKAQALPIYIPRIHWSGQCSKIFRNRQNTMVSIVHESWRGLTQSTRETTSGRWSNTGGERRPLFARGTVRRVSALQLCLQLAESNRLPPTLGALEEHTKRVRWQSRMWCQATVMQQQ